jgi:hypothetical protein
VGRTLGLADRKSCGPKGGIRGKLVGPSTDRKSSRACVVCAKQELTARLSGGFFSRFGDEGFSKETPFEVRNAKHAVPMFIQLFPSETARWSSDASADALLDIPFRRVHGPELLSAANCATMGGCLAGSAKGLANARNRRRDTAVPVPFGVLEITGQGSKRFFGAGCREVASPDTRHAVVLADLFAHVHANVSGGNSVVFPTQLGMSAVKHCFSPWWEFEVRPPTFPRASPTVSRWRHQVKKSGQHGVRRPFAFRCFCRKRFAGRGSWNADERPSRIARMRLWPEGSRCGYLCLAIRTAWRFRGASRRTGSSADPGDTSTNRMSHWKSTKHGLRVSNAEAQCLAINAASAGSPLSTVHPERQSFAIACFLIFGRSKRFSRF